MAVIFSWDNGNTRTYTRRLDLAEVAIKNGLIVKIVKEKSLVTVHHR
jgi:hypothetical protein